MAEEAQAHEVQMKGDYLHDTWHRLRGTLTERIDLMQTYVRVHSLAVQISESLDDVELKLKDVTNVTMEVQPAKEVDELWLNAKQKYMQLNNVGRNFMADALKVLEGSLNKSLEASADM